MVCWLVLFIEIFPDALARLLWCIIILQPVDGKVDDFLVDFFWVAVLKPLPQEGDFCRFVLFSLFVLL